MDKQTIKVVAKEFYKYLDNEKGAAHNTMRAYRSDIEDFVRFIEKSPAEMIDHNTIRAYIVDVYKDLKKSSLARKVSAIKVFFRFMKKKGYIDENTALIIRSPRIEKTSAQVLHDRRDVPFSRFPAEGRMAQHQEPWRSLSLCIPSGMRASEVLSLDREDLHLEGMWARVMGKGGKERIVPFGEKAKEALEAYLALAGKIEKFNANKALFINFRGETAHIPGPLEHHEETSDQGAAFQEPGPARDQAFFCHPYAGQRGGSSEHPGIARPFEAFDDPKYTHISMDKLMEIYDKSHPRR